MVRTMVKVHAGLGVVIPKGTILKSCESVIVGSVLVHYEGLRVVLFTDQYEVV